MNYYEHHIGDHLKKTAHLSAMEDGICRRLLDRYYTTEAALPADVRECCKLARAATRAEREAVVTVLGDVFVLREDGYHQARADEEIARYQGKQRKAQASANARWGGVSGRRVPDANAPPNHVRSHDGSICTTDANAYPKHAENICKSDANGMPRARRRAPVPSPHTPYPIQPSTAVAADVARAHEERPPLPAQEPSRAGVVCRLLREAGMADVNPGHPQLLRLLEAGASDEELLGAGHVAIDRGKGFAYAMAIVQRQRTEAAAAPQGDRAAVVPWQPSGAGETTYQRSMRERVEAFAPALAARPPGQSIALPATLIGDVINADDQSPAVATTGDVG